MTKNILEQIIKKKIKKVDLLKKSLKGGNSIIDEEEINLEENDLWLILASLENHGSTPIQKGERFIFSFGGLVPIKQIESIIT